MHKRTIRGLLAGLLGLMLVGVVSFLIWAYTGYSASSEAQEALKQAEVDNGDWYAFNSTESPSAPSSVGVILYPGARVSADAYALVAQRLAIESGALIVVGRAPLNLPILDQDAAADVITAYPAVERWVVGGHSLGGVAAASFAEDSSPQVDGLLLWASYPSGATELNEAEIEVSSIYGTRDGLLDRQSLVEAQARLPTSTTYVEIEGSNHSYFGDYGAQSGDNEPKVSREEARKAIIGASEDLIERVRRK